ncbi:hypothetical protein, partial [Pseudomonas agarici]
YSLPGTNEISLPSFNKDPAKSFSMTPPAGTLTLLSSESSEWGGSFDATLPPSEINLSNSTLIMRAVPNQPTDIVDFSIGPYIPKMIPHPLVIFVISDSSFEAKNFNTIKAGGPASLVIGMAAAIHLDLTLKGTSLYQVECLNYASTKKMQVMGCSTAKIRAEDILLTFSQYNISRSSQPSSQPLSQPDHYSLNVEATTGTITLAETGMVFSEKAWGKLKSTNIILRKNIGIAVNDDASVTFVTDLVSFYDVATTAQFSIADNANITFQTYSGGYPFDFKNEKLVYPEGLFNLQKNCKGKIILYGIGSAFD